jgi:mannose-6-phosphate isomerase-like protein (cupin superfamily)
MQTGYSLSGEPQSTANEEPCAPPLQRISLANLAARVTDTYRNFVVNAINDHCVRVAVMQGEYRWHRHPQSDECFLTLEGHLEIDLDGGQTIHLGPGELFTIPKGVVHRTRARVRTVNLCFEDRGAYTDVEFLDEGNSRPSPSL